LTKDLHDKISVHKNKAVVGGKIGKLTIGGLFGN